MTSIDARIPVSRFSWIFGRRRKPKKETEAAAAPKDERAPVGSLDDVAIMLERIRDASLSMSHHYNGSSTTLASQVSDLSSTIAVLYPTMVTLHRTSREQEQKNAVLEKSMTQLTAKLRASQEDLSHHKKRVADAEAEIDALSSQKASLSEQVDRLESDLSRKREAVDRAEAELSVEKRRLAELEATGRILETRLTKREAELLASRSEAAQLSNDLTESKMLADARQKSISRLSKALAAEQAVSAKKEALLIQADNDLQHTRSLLKRREKEAEATRARYEAEIERLRGESHEARYAQEALQSRGTTLEKILKSQREKLQSSSQHIAYLQSSMRGMLAGNRGGEVIDLSFDLDDSDEPEAPPAPAEEKSREAGHSDETSAPIMPPARSWDEIAPDEGESRVIQIATGRKKGQTA